MPVALQNLPPADGSFSGAGAAAWNGSPVWSGLTAGQILYPSSTSALTDNAGFIWGGDITAGRGLTIASGIATTNVNNVTATQTWNAAGVTFTGWKFTITDTASAAGSLAMQILGGASGTTNLVSVDNTGALSAPILLAGSGAPSISFAADPNTGFSNPPSERIRVITNGSALAEFNNGGSRFTMISGGLIGWGSSTTDPGQSLDSAISRISAGLIGVGTGAAASFAGRLKFTSGIAAAVAIANLNAAPTAGEIQSVNDALAPVAGAAVGAGGAANALVWWNGAQWTVVSV